MMQAKAIGARKDYMGYGLAVVLAGVLALVLLNPSESQQARYQPHEAIFARKILFSDRIDGGISIRDAATGQLIGEIQPGEGGFVRGALRGFIRERRLENPGAESPLRLAALQGGAIILEDPASGRWTDLRAFGATNLQSFAEILFKKNEEGKCPKKATIGGAGALMCPVPSKSNAASIVSMPMPCLKMWCCVPVIR